MLRIFLAVKMSSKYYIHVKCGYSNTFSHCLRFIVNERDRPGSCDAIFSRAAVFCVFAQIGFPWVWLACGLRYFDVECFDACCHQLHSNLTWVWITGLFSRFVHCAELLPSLHVFVFVGDFHLQLCCNCTVLVALSVNPIVYQ